MQSFLRSYFPSNVDRSNAAYRRIQPLSIISTAVGVMSLFSVGQPANAQFFLPSAQQSIPNTLSVIGQGVERIPTTLAQVQLGVEAKGTTAQQVQQDVSKRAATVVSFLKAQGAENLRTSGIALNPQYSSNKGTQTLTGYIASNTVSFRTLTEKAGSFIDDAVKNGANRVTRLSFSATEAAISEAQKAALRKAAMDAQEKTKILLDALGLKSKGIAGAQSFIQTPAEPTSFPSFYPPRGVIPAPTPIVSGEQIIQVSLALQTQY